MIMVAFVHDGPPLSVQVQHQVRLAASEKECAQDRFLLRSRMEEEAEQMSSKHEQELFTLVEEVREKYT